MKLKQPVFKIPQKIIIPCPNTNDHKIEVTYYSDCVFKALKYKIPAQVNIIDEQKTIQMNFQFLSKQVKIQPRVLDNIGVLCIEGAEYQIKYGIRITLKGDDIYVCLIK